MYLLSCTVSEIQHSRCEKLLYFATALAFKPPTDGFPWKDLCKIFRGCQWMAKVPNGEEKLPEISTGWVGRTNVTDRQTTDRRKAIAYQNCTDLKVDNNHALCTHEALHGVTAIKFCVKIFYFGFGAPVLWGPWAAAPLAHWVIQDSPRNLPIEFGTNPSKIFLVIVVTDTQTHTHKPTPVKRYFLAFAGIINTKLWTTLNKNAYCNVPASVRRIKIHIHKRPVDRR